MENVFFEEYKRDPKWKGKIFMQDEKTCFIDGFKIAVENLKCCANCSHRDYDVTDKLCCKLGRTEDFEPVCQNFDKWEFSQNKCSCIQ